MAGHIPEHFIDELMARVDIVDVIDSRVPLRKAGHEFKACCPFHDEKTPSFTVSPAKQFYHCFGCGAHGTAIGFLMEYEHLDFVTAVEDLAARAGLTVPQEKATDKESSPTAPVYASLEQAAVYYQAQLRDHAQAPRAIDYLKGRGLSGEVVARFGVGFAPPGWDNFGRRLEGPAASRAALDAGLLIEGKGKAPYDRFRDRIMFPIRDRRGRVIAFGGRVLSDDDTPKYLNSPETVVFHKGRELYGLYEACKALRRVERLLVVEGYMDVVALAQYGINYAVATLGTAATRDHIERLFRTSHEAVLCFDGDRAGREAAWKAVVTALPVLADGRQLRILMLPEGEDPDSLVRAEGMAAFESRVAAAMPVSVFFFEQLSGGVDMGTLDGRAALVEAARPLLATLPAGAFRQLMTDRLAELSRLQAAAVEGLVGAPPAKKGPRARAATARNARRPLSLVARAIAMLLQHPSLVESVQAIDIKELTGQPGVDLLVRLLEILHLDPTLSTGALVERWRGTEAEHHLARLAGWELGTPDEGLHLEFQGALDRLLAASARAELARLLEISRDKGLDALTEDEKTLLRAQFVPTDVPPEGS